MAQPKPFTPNGTRNEKAASTNKRKIWIAVASVVVIAAVALAATLWISAKKKAVKYGIELVLVPAGSFKMGSDSEDHWKPVHDVTISQPFYMGKYEVTQAQWQAVMGSNPSNFKGDNLPVENVEWDDAIAFIARLNAQNNGFTYRLPTEAEWEYACRAGTTGDYAGDLDAMAWYRENSGNTTHAVGTKLPNAFGLFDMHGNVWEWCQDWYHDSYNAAPGDGSAWLSGGEQKLRVLRGGSFMNFTTNLRSALRNSQLPFNRGRDYGFRVVAHDKQDGLGPGLQLCNPPPHDFSRLSRTERQS